MGRLSKASRSYLFLLREDKTTMDNTHEWCAEGGSPQIDNLKNLPCDMFPWWMTKLCKRGVIHITDVSKMPAEANAEKEILESQDIKSVLVLPLYIGKELAGFIGFDNVTDTGEWSDDDLAMLRMSSEIIGNALDLKQAEEREKQLQAQLHLSSRLASIGELASGVAHEINNPLTAVIGFSQMLMGRDIPEDVREQLEVINDNSQRVAKVVKNLLIFARRHKPGKEYVNINSLISGVLELRAYEMKLSGIEITTRLAPDLPWTVADRGQLQQVFLNIILNAEQAMVKAHNKGNLLIKTGQINNSIRISFKDDGPGIRKENMDRLYDPFFTTKAVGEGTGLGLSISYGIIKQHNGEIHADSKLAKGATFIIKLPIVAEAKQLELAESPGEEPGRVTGARIMVVDDELDICKFLDRALTQEGHKVETIDNASAALERLKCERYNLILLDIKMVGMDGIELYRRMKEIAPSLQRRVVFITGDTMTLNTRNFLNKTKAHYIAKPFDVEQLKKEINQILIENV